MRWDRDEEQRDRWVAEWAASDYEFDDLAGRAESGEYWPEDTTENEAA